jgi:hypothetical protein
MMIEARVRVIIEDEPVRRPHMPDQIIDAAIAQGLHTDACRTSLLVGWLVTRDPPDYPGKVIARLVTDGPTFYVLVADTMGELHAALPSALVRSDRQPADLPGVVEIWFSRDG